eukprot:g6811.t1
MQDQGDTWRFDLGDGDSIGGNGHATDQPTSVLCMCGAVLRSLSFYLFGCGCCRSQKPTIFPLNEQRLWEPAGPLLLPKRPFLAEDADPEDPAPRHEHSVRVAITLAVSDGDHGWWPIPLQLRRRNTRRHLMDGYWRSFGHGGLPALVALPSTGARGAAHPSASRGVAAPGAAASGGGGISVDRRARFEERRSEKLSGDGLDPASSEEYIIFVSFDVVQVLHEIKNA